jgi:hypothetical protein
MGVPLTLVPTCCDFRCTTSVWCWGWDGAGDLDGPDGKSFSVIKLSPPRQPATDVQNSLLINSRSNLGIHGPEQARIHRGQARSFDEGGLRGSAPGGRD